MSEMSRKFLLEHLEGIKALPREKRDTWGITGEIWGDPRWTSEAARIFDRAMKSWPKYSGNGRSQPVPVPAPYKTQDDMFYKWIESKKAYSSAWSVWTCHEQFSDDWEDLLDHMIQAVQFYTVKDIIEDYLYLCVPCALIFAIVGIVVM